MSLIYEPQGKAKEYADLALNVYTQCDHECRYCYVPSIKKPLPGGPYHRIDFRALDREAKALDCTKRILLSFMTDPYCLADVALKDTRSCLHVLLDRQLPISILTKGGDRLYRDWDLILRFRDIKVGATLTFIDPADRVKWEPYAQPTESRIEVLRMCHNVGIRTWASIEPVIDPNQSLQLIQDTLDFVDEYKVGKLNHHPELEAQIDWSDFGKKAVSILEKARKPYYIKKDLRDRMV